MGLLGNKCFCCKKRYWQGGAVLRYRHAGLEEGEYAEAHLCEECAKEMDRVVEVGDAMREGFGEVFGHEKDSE